MAWFMVGPIREILPEPLASVGPPPGKIVQTFAIIEAADDQAAVDAVAGWSGVASATDYLVIPFDPKKSTISGGG